MKRIKALFLKYNEPILYIIFGVLTTLVNIVSYWIWDKLGFSTAFATVLAWVLSVAFAFITNKIFVFESKASGLRAVAKEVLQFFSCRFTTGILDLGIMLLFVEVWNFNGLLIKVLSNILVIVLNYILSKLIIFKK